MSAIPRVSNIQLPKAETATHIAKLHATSPNSSMKHSNMHVQVSLGLMGASVSLVSALVCPGIAPLALNATELIVPIQTRDSALPHCQADPSGQSPQWANAENDGCGK